MALMWTFPFHDWFYSSVRVGTLGEVTHLRLEKSWGHTYELVYFYAGLIFLTTLVSRHLWRKGPLYRSQLFWFLLALTPPVAGNLFSLFGVGPLSDLDLSAVTLSVTAGVLIWGVRGRGLFEVVPVARGWLVEKMRDGVVVLDRLERVVDMNPAAMALLHTDAGSIGKEVSAVFPAELCSQAGAEEEVVRQVNEESGEVLWLELRRLALRSDRGAEFGSIHLIRDVTRQKRLEVEREALILELRESLENVKKLQGLIPICAGCKKVRDDTGYWSQVEVYLKSHSGLEFSHGMCPECMKTYYGDALDSDERD